MHYVPSILGGYMNSNPDELDDKLSDDQVIAKFFNYIQQQQIDSAAHRKREQRNSILAKVGWMGVIVLGLVLYYVMFDSFLGDNIKKPDEYVALVELTGAIMPKGGTSAEALIAPLTEAFEDEKAKGVLLRINSPGGTPVQASIIYDNIVRLRAKHPDKKFRVVAEDSVASGAYWVAVSSDKIYVNNSSMVGSIGVVMQGYGFTELASRFGVKRRIFTAGDNKVRLDSFKPVTEQDLAKVNDTLNKLHQHFIAAVREGRNCDTSNAEDCLLNLDTPGLFSGDFWVGSQALEIGLVDGIADIYQVMNDDFGVDEYHLYQTRKQLFGKLGTWLSFSLEKVITDILTTQQIQPMALQHNNSI